MDREPRAADRPRRRVGRRIALAAALAAVAVAVATRGWSGSFDRRVEALGEAGAPVRVADAVELGMLPEEEDSAAAWMAAAEAREVAFWELFEARAVEIEFELSRSPLALRVSISERNGPPLVVPPDDPWATHRAEIDAQVETEAEVVRRAILAAARPRGRFVAALPPDPRSLSEHTWPATCELGNDLWPVERLSYTLALHALARVRSGDPAGAVRAIEALFGLANAFLREPYAPTQRAGAYVQITGCALLLDLAGDGLLPLDDLPAWSRRLRVESEALRWRDAIEIYRAGSIELVESLRDGRVPHRRRVPDWVDRVPVLAGQSISRDGVRFLAAIDEVLRLADRPYWEIGDRLRDVDAAMAEAARAPWSTLDLYWCSMDPPFKEVADLRTAVGLVRAALAALDHRRTRGVWPGSLEALFPDPLEAVPVDHRTGHAIEFAVHGDDARLVSPGVGEWPLRPPPPR